MVTYPVSRFLIEYLRNDEAAFFAGLTISQNISVVLFLGGVLYWAWLSRQPRELYRDHHQPVEPRSGTAAAGAVVGLRAS